jgi:hypothetical protein
MKAADTNTADVNMNAGDEEPVRQLGQAQNTPTPSNTPTTLESLPPHWNHSHHTGITPTTLESLPPHWNHSQPSCDTRSSP